MWYHSKRVLGLLGAVGLAVYLRGIWLYDHRGFTHHLWLFWTAGCVSLLAVFFLLESRKLTHTMKSGTLPRQLPAGLVRRDWIAAGLLLLVFAPIYITGVHDFPRQMNTDEIVIMNTERTLASAPNVDIFGPSYYSDLPTLIFWLLGKIGVVFGGVTLGHMRAIHAASGVLVIVLCFLLLRLLKLPRYAAVAGAAVIGLNHSLFFLSRMALRDNTAVLFEVAALLLFYYGWQRRSYAWTLLGGFVAGLTFYTYYPSRITIVIWLAFIFLTTAGGKFKNWRMAGALAATAVVGLAMVAAPLFIANSKHVATDPYPTHQYLWQKEARAQEKQFRGTATTAEAVKINIVHGLTAFNHPYSDQGLLYDHAGFGFVDSVTGILLWMGVVLVLMQAAYKRRVSDGDLLALTGFLMIWLSMAFLLTRAPDYTRLLIVLPFVGYLIARAVVVAATIVVRMKKGKRSAASLPWLIVAVLVVVLALANGAIARDFYRRGNVGGDSVGDTIRYQEQHRNENARWIFVNGISADYFYWGIPAYWQFWLNFVDGPDRPVRMTTVDELTSFEPGRLAPADHGYLLTTGDVWLQTESAFSIKEHVLSVTQLDPLRNRLVIVYQDWQ